MDVNCVPGESFYIHMQTPTIRTAKRDNLAGAEHPLLIAAPIYPKTRKCIDPTTLSIQCI